MSWNKEWDKMLKLLKAKRDRQFPEMLEYEWSRKRGVK